jgi:hypothetical protein
LQVTTGFFVSLSFFFFELKYSFIFWPKKHIDINIKCTKRIKNFLTELFMSFLVQKLLKFICNTSFDNFFFNFYKNNFNNVLNMTVKCMRWLKGTTNRNKKYLRDKSLLKFFIETKNGIWNIYNKKYINFFFDTKIYKLNSIFYGKRVILILKK